MPWAVAAAGITAAGALGSGIMGANAASSAADSARQSAQAGQQFQQQVYGNTVQNLQPFVNSGNTALSSLMGLLGLGGSGQNGSAQSAFNQFSQTPAFTFPQQQGQLALQRQLASSGLTGSGGALKDAIAYNQGYASQGMNSYLSQLSSLASLGQNSAALTGSQGNQASSNVLQSLLAQGNASANGIVGANNALTGGVNNALGSLTGPNGTNLQALSKLFGSSSYTGLGASQNPDFSGGSAIAPAGGLT